MIHSGAKDGKTKNHSGVKMERLKIILEVVKMYHYFNIFDIFKSYIIQI